MVSTDVVPNYMDVHTSFSAVKGNLLNRASAVY